jgi:hypothetical protein
VVTPRTLVVKSAIMELIARRIINSQLTGTTINDTATDVFDKGTMNPLAGIIPADGVVRDPFFTDSNDWYLFADPNDVPGVRRRLPERQRGAVHRPQEPRGAQRPRRGPGPLHVRTRHGGLQGPSRLRRGGGRPAASANGWHIERAYGITIEQYDEMLARQDGVCAICRGEETRTMAGTVLALCVDHDHETGRVRGLLCHPCNMLLGFARDDEERLQAAVRYLSEGGA